MLLSLGLSRGLLTPAGGGVSGAQVGRAGSAEECAGLWGHRAQGTPLSLPNAHIFRCLPPRTGFWGSSPHPQRWGRIPGSQGGSWPSPSTGSVPRSWPVHTQSLAGFPRKKTTREETVPFCPLKCLPVPSQQRGALSRGDVWFGWRVHVEPRPGTVDASGILLPNTGDGVVPAVTAMPQ